MRNLTDREYDLIKSIMRLTQDELLDSMETFLVESFSEDRVIATPDYVYAIGDIPIMLVAHLDTVHLSRPYEIFYDKDENVMWSPQGIGADDRAGVFAIVKLLSEGYKPSVLFTTDEEIGALGAQIAAAQIKPEVNFVVQLDRRGAEDSVYYECDNEDFEKYINKFGFETALGSFSDISQLCPEWKIAGVNLSIGYVDEHTKYERLYVSHMLDTMEKVKKMLEQVNKDDKFEYIEAEFSFSFAGNTTGTGGSRRPDVAYSSKLDRYVRKDLCYGCFGDFPSDEIIDMAKHGLFCGDCYADMFTTCIDCGLVFKDRYKTHLQCEDCRKEDN